MSILLTERAAEKIKALIGQRDLPAGACLRVAVREGGCARYSYTMDVTGAPGPDDETFVSHEVSVVCDPKSYRFLRGTTIDFDESPGREGFVFDNPNAERRCRCGESFSA